jgi:hypothetical protein
MTVDRYAEQLEALHAAAAARNSVAPGKAR